ncbi:MAG: hypothetical protein AAF600_06310 [Bacteroidota bacterium]
MLRFFRINDPYRLVFIFLILITVRLAQQYLIQDTSYYELKWILLGEWLGKGYMMYSQTFDYTGPLAAMTYKFINMIFGRTQLVFWIISSLLIILQASIFNSLLLKNKVYAENSYLPAFFYTILIISIPDFMTLSPQLMSLTFILLTLRNVFRRIDNQVTDELFLSSGIFIGLAAMIYLPACVFFLVFLFSLVLFTTAIARRLLLYFFGFLLIFSLFLVYYYLFGIHGLFVERFIIDGLFASTVRFVSLKDLLFISAPLAFVFLIAVFKTVKSARLTNFQQKVQQVIWILLLGGIATFFLSNEKSGLELLFTVPVVAYFLTHYFILLKKQISVFIIPGAVIFSLLFYSGYTYQNLPKSLIIEEPDLIGGKVLVLGEKLELYAKLEMITPCFNEYISGKALKGINYYEEAIILYDILQRSDPDIIIDELKVMPKLIFRFPYLEETYSKVSSNDYRRINN